MYKKVNDSSLELECDSNDECSTSLDSLLPKIYLVNSDAKIMKLRIWINYVAFCSEQ